MSSWSRRGVGVFAVVALVGLGASHRAYLFAGNLHTVIPGEIYRSAQPTPERLGRWTDDLDLQSVLNLKGRDEWKAQREDSASRVAWYAVRMSARRLPNPEEVARLIAVLDEAPRPLLVHCHGGTDRSGLASAVALLLEGGSLEQARAQFATTFGYPGRTLGSPQPDFLNRYEAWLRAEAVAHAPERFRRWVATDYVAGYYEAELAIEPPAQSLRTGEPFSLFVSVTNRSPETIPLRCEAGRGVRLSLRTRALGERPRRSPGDRRFCNRDLDLEPGKTVRLEADGYRMSEPGRYEWTADLVDEHREQWFEHMGSEATRRVFTLL